LEETMSATGKWRFGFSMERNRKNISKKTTDRFKIGCSII